MKTKWWMYGAATVAVLIVFSVAYSVGAAVRSATSEVEPAAPPQPAVSPGALPTGVLAPGLPKPLGGQRFEPAPYVGLVGAVYPKGPEVYSTRILELPFEFGFPRPPLLDEDRSGESSTTIYRRALTRSDPGQAEVDLRIAVRPCGERAACLAGRAAFDADWTKEFKATAPATPRGDRTWFGAGGKRYQVTLSHAFRGPAGRWWLVGAVATGDQAQAQRVINDIWAQTP
ncbi:hypothetical protein [Kribbella sp. NPDC051770]|uniref:hypothetical protein n=1 Tax=Kribbella sp. NPDC051770 TaxID=3155413 RepID=UPI00343DD03E